MIDAVAAFDLAPFYASYQDDGWGRAAHDPAMMLALLLYACAIGERSSRRIERRCEDDVAFRVIAANRVPDHATIARLRVRHERALADLFADVLRRCAEAELVRVELVAVDGTKLHANASNHATRDDARIAEEILAEADAVDHEEDERFGERRGDELPPHLSSAQGRRAWLRDARRRLDDERAERARPVARSRRERLKEAKRRLEEEHEVECRANDAYEAYRARGVMKDGRRFGGPPSPIRLPVGMAAHHRDTQPHEASPPPDRDRRALTGSGGAIAAGAGRSSPTIPGKASRTFAQQPRRYAAASLARGIPAGHGGARERERCPGAVPPGQLGRPPARM